MSFGERYRKALAFKSPDVEEPIDMGFHRPLAAVVAAALQSTPITPNQVTIASLVVGLAGSALLYDAFFGAVLDAPVAFVGAAALLLVSVVLDCADGQLARARGGGSRVGRILDGLVDAVVLVPAYAILGFGIRQEFGLLWFWVAVVAGVTTWIRCIIYDKVKNLYTAHTKPGATSADGTETLASVRADYDDARQSGSLLEVVLLRIYLFYLFVQARLSSSAPATEPSPTTVAQAEAYRADHRLTMRLASLMGLGTQMWLLYTSIALAAVWIEAVLVVQALLASVFVALMLVVLARSRAMQV